MDSSSKDAQIVIPPAPVVPPNPAPAPKENLIHIKSDSEYAEITAAAGFEGAVLYYWATWCGPCRQMGPIYEEVAKENPNILFYKIDVDKCKEAARIRRVEAIPTIFIGEQRLVGAQSKQTLQRIIDEDY